MLSRWRMQEQHEGKKPALVRVLARAGLMLSPEDQGRIATCSDIATLDRWFDNALVARTVADVFG